MSAKERRKSGISLSSAGKSGVERSPCLPVDITAEPPTIFCEGHLGKFVWIFSGEKSKHPLGMCFSTAVAQGPRENIIWGSCGCSGTRWIAYFPRTYSFCFLHLKQALGDPGSLLKALLFWGSRKLGRYWEKGERLIRVQRWWSICVRTKGDLQFVRDCEWGIHNRMLW